MLTPASRQMSISRLASLTSLAPQALKNSLPPPKVPVPSVSTGTLNPELPSCRYSICSPLGCAILSAKKIPQVAPGDLFHAAWARALAARSLCRGLLLHLHAMRVALAVAVLVRVACVPGLLLVLVAPLVPRVAEVRLVLVAP